MTTKKPSQKRKPKRTRVRKPKEIKWASLMSANYVAIGNYYFFLDSRECRRLARWLNQAADWLEQENVK